MAAAVGNIMAIIMIIQTARNSGAFIPMVGEYMRMSASMPIHCQTSTVHAAAATTISSARMTFRCKISAMG